jgi:heterodisulfide reductase subunit C
MQIVSQLVFLGLLSVASFFIYKSLSRIAANIRLGRPEDRNDQPKVRWRNMALVAMGQKKMFQKPLPAILHLVVYLGFIIVNLEMLEIVLDGLLGTHRLFLPFLGGLYAAFVSVFEILAVGVILACIVFLFRRFLVKVPRLTMKELNKWPQLDATIILAVEIVLMLAFLTMNATDLVLQEKWAAQYHSTGAFLISTCLAPLFSNWESSTLVLLERGAWWLHIIGVLAFANYVFWNSKHLHIFMAFLNTYFFKIGPMGKLNSMPEVTKEVNLMLGLSTEASNNEGAPARFGAKDVNDLSWKNLMDAYSCTECGRCTQQCPANITGKKLSPRKIMMDTRDRLEEFGAGIRAKGKEFNDGKSLLGDYILEEEILACTTCNACVQACPINIDPLNIIMQLRRYKVMEESAMPNSWGMMMSNLENNQAPWKFPVNDRFNWSQNIEKRA